MGRPKGSRSADYEDKKKELALAISRRLMKEPRASFAALADHAGVSRPTLRHYFEDRDGAVRAALRAASTLGEPHIRGVAGLPIQDAPSALTNALSYLIEGWRDYGVGHLHEVGIQAGLEDEPTGKVYLQSILEPLLQAIEELLGRLVAGGHLGPHDLRGGALMLVSPVVVGLLHQDALGGGQLRGLDVDRLATTLVDAYCRAHPPDGV